MQHWYPSGFSSAEREADQVPDPGGVRKGGAESLPARALAPSVSDLAGPAPPDGSVPDDQSLELSTAVGRSASRSAVCLAPAQVSQPFCGEQPKFQGHPTTRPPARDSQTIVGQTRGETRTQTFSSRSAVPIQTLREGREQHVPDPFDHSRYQIKLFRSRYPAGDARDNQAV